MNTDYMINGAHDSILFFDDDDLRQTHQQAHFYEWIGAIVLHHLTGYDALVEKYGFEAHGPHPKKKKL
jgi:hypothetical protein